MHGARGNALVKLLIWLSSGNCLDCLVGLRGQGLYEIVKFRQGVKARLHVLTNIPLSTSEVEGLRAKGSVSQIDCSFILFQRVNYRKLPEITSALLN